MTRVTQYCLRCGRVHFRSQCPHRSVPRSSQPVSSGDLEIVILGFDVITEELEARVFEAGFDDGLLHSSDGLVRICFYGHERTRESALQALRAVGLEPSDDAHHPTEPAPPMPPDEDVTDVVVDETGSEE